MRTVPQTRVSSSEPARAYCFVGRFERFLLLCFINIEEVVRVIVAERPNHLILYGDSFLYKGRDAYPIRALQYFLL